MTTVQEILHRKPHSLVSITPSATVYEALELMAHHEVGAVIVLDAGRLVGMFSERDYARKVILLGKSSKDLLVREIMTARVLVVSLCDTVDICMALMTNNRVRHLPVCDGEAVIGLVSIGDVVKAMLDEQRFVIEQLEHYIRA